MNPREIGGSFFSALRRLGLTMSRSQAHAAAVDIPEIEFARSADYHPGEWRIFAVRS